MLWKNEGLEALKYLRENRGLTDDVIKEFEIGYCPGFIDDNRLRGKIILPIHDAYGDLIAVSTRVPYTKQFWHESYPKGVNLYGLHRAKPYIVKYDKAIVVEGEFDVAFLYAHGFKMTVGCLGGAFGVIQASLLARYCSEIFFVFDGDEGGYETTERAMKKAKESGLTSYLKTDLIAKVDTKFIPVKLPDGYDPDDYLKKHGDKQFIKILQEAREAAMLN